MLGLTVEISDFNFHLQDLPAGHITYIGSTFFNGSNKNDSIYLAVYYNH